MTKSYFNSSLPIEYYKKIKIEAIELGITIRQHISNILKMYVEEKFPEVKDDSN